MGGDLQKDMAVFPGHMFQIQRRHGIIRHNTQDLADTQIPEAFARPENGQGAFQAQAIESIFAHGASFRRLRQIAQA